MADGPDYPYRPPRTLMMGHGELYSDGRALGAVRIRNLSAQGLCASGFQLRCGQHVQFRLNGIGRINGHVIWTNGPVFGVCLAQEIAVEDFDLTGDLCGGENFAAGIADPGEFRR